MPPDRRSLAATVLLVFAPVLLLAGGLGFGLPEGMMSGAPAYNVFHLAFGALGLAIALSGSGPGIRWFLIGFGAVDLYQAAASFLHLFPEAHFRWKPADDVLHLAIGTGLVVVGVRDRLRS